MTRLRVPVLLLATLTPLFLTPRFAPVRAGAAALDPCACTIWMTGAPAVSLFCPKGDGDNLYLQDWRVWVRVVDAGGAPMTGVLQSDIRITGCSGQFCGCPPTIYAAAPTNADGVTHFNVGSLTAGGYDTGFGVVVLGQRLKESDCTTNLCVPVEVRSIDLSRNAVVDFADFAEFGTAYFDFQQGTYHENCDFNFDDAVDVIDFSIFARHYDHVCSGGAFCM